MNAQHSSARAGLLAIATADPSFELIRADAVAQHAHELCAGLLRCDRQNNRDATGKGE